MIKSPKNIYKNKNTHNVMLVLLKSLPDKYDDINPTYDQYKALDKMRDIFGSCTGINYYKKLLATIDSLIDIYQELALSCTCHIDIGRISYNIRYLLMEKDFMIKNKDFLLNSGCIVDPMGDRVAVNPMDIPGGIGPTGHQGMTKAAPTDNKELIAQMESLNKEMEKIIQNIQKQQSD